MKTGDEAPDFCATTHRGEEICLRDFRGKKAVVLFFYPQDYTPVCTQEACSFRDSYEQFVAAGAEVIGISGNSTESHQGFASANRLPFDLLSDNDGKLRRLFEVTRPLGFLPGRVTYVIDKQGILRHQFSALFQGEKHVTEALKIIEQLQQEP